MTLHNNYFIHGKFNDFELDLSASGHWIVESVHNGERFSIGHTDEWTLGEAIHEAFYMANSWLYDVEYKEEEKEEFEDSWEFEYREAEMVINNYGWD